MRYDYDLSPLTFSSTAEKTSRTEFFWTPQRYVPESLWAKLVMVIVNFPDLLSSLNLILPFCLLSEVISACCRHVEDRFPLQMYLK